MALDMIINKILSASRAEADSIISSAHRKAQEIIAQASDKAQKDRENRIREARELFLNERLKNMALAKLESRKKILKARCDLIDLVFAKAMGELGNISTEDHRHLIHNLLNRFIPQNPCEIIVYEPEADLFSTILSSLWGEAFTRFCSMVKVSKPLGGGFILRTKGLEFDCTYEQLIRERRIHWEHAISRILIPDNSLWKHNTDGS
jgi:V/A-type H+-transporting ATPase subunit E